jgi:hypothetical protein
VAGTRRSTRTALGLLFMGLALAAMPTGALAQGDVWYVVTHSGKNLCTCS